MMKKLTTSAKSLIPQGVFGQFKRDSSLNDVLRCRIKPHSCPSNFKRNFVDWVQKGSKSHLFRQQQRRRTWIFFFLNSAKNCVLGSSFNDLKHVYWNFLIFEWISFLLFLKNAKMDLCPFCTDRFNFKII